MPRALTHKALEFHYFGKVGPMTDALDSLSGELKGKHQVNHNLANVISLATKLQSQEFPYEFLVMTGKLHLDLDIAIHKYKNHLKEMGQWQSARKQPLKPKKKMTKNSKKTT